MEEERDGPFDDLCDVTARFPWHIGLVLAIVVYLLLHYIAVEGPAASPRGELEVSVGAQIVKALATVGQYLLPAIFLFVALGSVFARRRLRNRRAENNTRGRELEIEHRAAPPLDDVSTDGPSKES